MQKNKSDIILEISNLKKYFVNGNFVNKAVDNVSFNVKRGEIVGLIGESGSGKTTVGRSLLRLYDDFSGFVTLDNQIISGKRISKKRNKFMRKNIQMIFQDPMAALNGQNNIFSILKEPLVVNGIIKSKVNDIKVDWNSVSNNFHYTFLEEALKLELENLRISNQHFGPFIKKWQSVKIDRFKANESLDDQFNSYFAFLEQKSKINSIIINNLYQNTEKLIDLYLTKQKDYREQKIDLDEVELQNAQREFKRLQALQRSSADYLQAKAELKVSFANYREIASYQKDFKAVAKNALRNFISEFKNESDIHKNEGFSSSSLNFFFHKYKLYRINLFIKKAIKSKLAKLKYLDFNELKDLMNDLQVYASDFYKQELQVDETKKASIKLIKTKISQNFKFDWGKYFELSEQRAKEFHHKLNASKIEGLTLFKKVFVKFFDKPAKNKEAYLAAKNHLQATQTNFETELAKYIEGYKQRIDDYNEQIQEQKRILKDLKNIEREEMTKFFQIHKEFVEFYKKEVLAPIKVQIKKMKSEKKASQNAKEIAHLKDMLSQKSIDLKVYNTNVKDKLDNNKSFDIEMVYVKKDISNIYLLLGVSPLDLKLYSHKLRTFANLVLSPWRNRRLSQLFTKITIYKALEDVGLLKQFAYRYPHEFSGGQRQRIVIARALITEPSVIVADEPIASLDISIQAQVVNLLKDLCKKKNIGMVFIAHDLSMIEYIADRVQIMHLGKIVESGVTEKIYKKPLHPYTINLFKAIPKISNANEKFKDVSFETDYLIDQQYPNIPFVFETEEDHFIYATDKQAHEWTNKFNLDIKKISN
ncbi:ATP-binding cassette domain-containing protein [Mycoplasmopsis gallopavonis]|uniref:ABC transporter ATP-binding protein n=2 Tax=Mycoplasmopsis gallopavonis TaxID=76629 RepID=A0A449B0G2_9BACT|nr:ATP-binding cassette domain-containing protein [Mycoplasmopsis gallopavonis]RIV16555.1 ATP-binding cassette domain-containing protein [Mycoplasmopsis gallopavonis]VEU73218.1 ABC transporter ATP-binding protein [Mycoplasmopsis gallopavonis]